MDPPCDCSTCEAKKAASAACKQLRAKVEETLKAWLDVEWELWNVEWEEENAIRRKKPDEEVQQWRAKIAAAKRLNYAAMDAHCATNAAYIASDEALRAAKASKCER